MWWCVGGWQVKCGCGRTVVLCCTGVGSGEGVGCLLCKGDVCGVCWGYALNNNEPGYGLVLIYSFIFCISVRENIDVKVVVFIFDIVVLLSLLQ